MIILDTHIWICWVDNNSRLTQRQRELINTYQSSGLGVSIISCWEVAKLVENNRLILSCSVHEWLDGAITYPGVEHTPTKSQIIVGDSLAPRSF